MYSAFGAFMYSTLLDLYSRETFRDVGRVFRTCNNFDYSPIVFIYENASNRYHNRADSKARKIKEWKHC